jgi:hypothetical protein
MTNNAHSGLVSGDGVFDPLFTALRRQDSDARISELVEALRRKGHARENIAGHVIRAVGSKAAARVQRIASQRAQHMASGTWQRYRMSRSRRIRLWLRDAQESIEDALQRLRGVVGGN